MAVCIELLLLRFKNDCETSSKCIAATTRHLPLQAVSTTGMQISLDKEREIKKNASWFTRGTVSVEIVGQTPGSSPARTTQLQYQYSMVSHLIKEKTFCPRKERACRLFSYRKSIRILATKTGEIAMSERHNTSVSDSDPHWIRTGRYSTAYWIWIHILGKRIRILIRNFEFGSGLYKKQ